MTEAKLLATESLELEKIRGLIPSPGPCITLALPAYRPGEHAKPIAALKSDLREAAHQLAQYGIPEPMTKELLEPLEQFAEDADQPAGSHSGSVIFRSLDTFRQFARTEPVKPSLHVGARFQIRPLLAELHLPAHFMLLKVSKKNVEAFRCTGLHAEPVKLPHGVPETLEEALAFKPPDHDLENRSSAGPSSGAIHGVRFGTGSARETQSTYLADFYKAVDRGVRELLGASEMPLVLAGVNEETIMYRMINRYPNLLAASVQGSQYESLEKDTLRHAWSIVRSGCAERALRAFEESKDRVAPARFSTNLSDILRSAADGRVESLYIDESAQRNGPGKWGEEDLLNIAAVETMLHGGQAFALPGGRMPEGAAAAAILRF